MHKISIIVLLALSFLNCSTEVSKRKDYKEVMKVHDFAMAEMGTITTLRKAIRSIEIDTLDNDKVLEQNMLIKQLDDAEEGMMVWMYNFKVPENKRKIKKFLEVQLHNVTLVNKHIYDAIGSAEKYLKDN